MSTYRKHRSKKRRRQIFINRLLLALACLALLALGAKVLLGRGAAEPAEPAEPSSAPVSTPAPTPTPSPEPTPDPQALLDEDGKAFMAWLTQQPGFTDLDLTVQEKYPYLLAVNLAASTVTVYTADEEGRYTRPYSAMVCSGGSDTPTGHFKSPVQYH